MKKLLKITQQDIKFQSPLVDTGDFRERKAARAVLLDNAGKVHMLNVSKHGYHKLPGGGIDEGEEIIEALERELMEEVGCKAEIIRQLGYIIEYRDYDELIQTSYCYLARQVGEQQKPNLEQSELDEGMYQSKPETLMKLSVLLQAINLTTWKASSYNSATSPY